MLLIDIFVRFPSITLCALLIVLLLRDARQYYQAWLASGALLTAIASSLHTMPAALALPYPIYVIALFLSVPALALQWGFIMSVLEDRFRPGVFGWVLMGAACLFKLGWSLQGIGINPPAHALRFFGTYAVSFIIMGHILWVALSGLRNDLVQPRRRVRYWFVLFLTLTSVSNIVTELAGYSSAVEAIFIHATSLPMLIWAVVWLSKLKSENLFHNAEPSTAPEPKTVPERMGPAFQKLVVFMEKAHGFTDQDLTVGRLATQIGLPEHQLRRLINQSLGYRNFATYLNSYRIAHAKSLLADPEQAQAPILTIAMNTGYKTLSTFNRAFKAAENETPSEFRSKSLPTAIAEAGPTPCETEKDGAIMKKATQI